MRTLLLTAAVLLAAAPPAPAQSRPRLAPERVVLNTVAGDIVLAFYPDVAPGHVRQVLRLVRLGVYDGTHFCRIDPTFVAQVSTAYDRLAPLTPEQRAAIHPLKAEFSGLRHRRGTLSMARDDGKPDSAETSFSVLLAGAPHLDGKYTVFGEVESGMDVIDAMCRAPRTGTAPSARLTVERAFVVDSPGELASLHLAGPRPVAAPEASPAPAVPRELAGGIALMVLCGLACFFLAGRLPARVLLSLNLIAVLVGGFLLFVLLFPAAQAHAAVAVALFLGLVGLLKLMGRFEAPA